MQAHSYIVFNVKSDADYSGVGQYMTQLKFFLKKFTFTEKRKCLLWFILSPFVGIKRGGIAIFSDEGWWLPALIRSIFGKSILIVHDIRRLNTMGPIMQFFFIKLIKSGTLNLIFVSLTSKQDFVKLLGCGHQFAIVMNPVSATIVNEIHVHGKIPALLYVGSFEERKKISTCIQYAETLKVKLFIRTSSFYYRRCNTHLKKIIENSENIELQLDLSAHELYMSNGYNMTFISFSEYEGFGRGYIEAQAAGLPVIAIKNNVTEEVLAGTVIYINDLNNIEKYSIINDIRKLNKYRCLGLENSKRFSVDRFIKELDKILIV